MPPSKDRQRLSSKEAVDFGPVTSGFLAHSSGLSCGSFFCLNPKVYLVSWISET
jgi:hypothetical protein